MLTIDWSQAPEWANYVAMDVGGLWYWYENKPVFDDGKWDQHGRLELIDSPAWETLSSRPQSPATLNTMDCKGGE